jgi:hypothetical protein
MELSKRAKACEALMKEGAYWRSQLETQYRGGEKFHHRLRSATGHVVHGYGFKTWAEMEDAHMLTTRTTAASSVWPTEWVLRTEAKEEAA